jgi:tetrahydrodipicolinate N-succinyltransferase
VTDTEQTIVALDRGELRVAEPGDDGDWRVNGDAQAAILDYFRICESSTATARAGSVAIRSPRKRVAGSTSSRATT